MPNNLTIDPSNNYFPTSDFSQENTPSKIKNVLEKFKKLKTKWLTKWLMMPKYAKFLSIVITCCLLLIVLLLFIFHQRLAKITNQFPSDTDNWQKLLIPQRQSPFFTLTTHTEKKFGILPDEKLILTTQEPVDQQFIEANLESSVPVTIKATDQNTYEITPANRVGLDQLLKLQLNLKDQKVNNTTLDRNYAWAFQTQGKFRVLSSVPANERNGVPLNAGIEIVFSQDDFQDPTTLISISPEIKFRSERKGATFVIVPLEPLQEKTIYTVTLKKGLNLESRHDPIDSDYQFSFQTAEENVEEQIYLSLADNFVQTTPGEKLETKVFAHDNLNQLKADVYMFKTAEDFVQSRKQIDEALASWQYYYDKEIFDVTGLSKVLSTDLSIHTVNKDEEVSTQYVQLPEVLSRGFYLIEFYIPGSNNEKTLIQQQWVQSTNLTAYVSVAKEQTLVWVNEFGQGPVAGAHINLHNSQQSAFTTADGLATFNTPSSIFDATRKYFYVGSGDDQLFLIVDSLKDEKKPNEVVPADYWTYLYHDRLLYQPSDTIDFFGVIKRRSDGTAPSIITVELLNYHRDQIIAAQNLTPASDGSFIGSLKFTDLPESSYELRVTVAGKEIIYRSFSVEKFVKPEIKIEVTGDKKAIFAGEKVNFSVNARFFDDTPVANTTMNAYESFNSSESAVKITTDEYGQVNYQYQNQDQELDSIRYRSVIFQPASAQEGDTEGFGSVLVFGSQAIIETELSSQEGSQAKFKALVSRVDLSGINQGTTSEYKGEGIPNQEVKLTLTKRWYEKVEKGTYYDFVEKTTKKSYEYKHREEVVEKKNINTDQDGLINYQFELESDKSYLVEVETVTHDQNSYPAKAKRYFYHSHYSDRNSLVPTPILSIKQEESEFSLGEQVDAEIKLGTDLYPTNEQSRFLFIGAQKGLQDSFVSNQPTYSFPFEKKHIPNINLGAVVFNGRYYLQAETQESNNFYFSYESYYNFNSLRLDYRSTDSQIDLVIKPEKNVYQPGDQAKITIKASQNNQALANTTINLAVVDQALAAIGGVIEPSILTSLYKTIPHFVYYGYGSHQPIHPNEPGAEMGGGGEDRDLFKDSAFFGTARTNNEGVAEFTFTLPDNITTWIIYTQAIDQQINAGWTEGKLSVTKDFFVTSQFPKEYLARDQAVLSANAYGTSLNANDRIAFRSIFSQGETELANKGQSAAAFNNVYFDFPALTSGDYQALLRGQVNDKKDGVQLPFKVIDSRFNLESASITQLSRGEVQNSLGVDKVISNKPITLVVSDQGQGVYYRELNRFCYASSNRLEKQLASKVASTILQEHFAKECHNVQENLKHFQTVDGGLSQVAWGSNDLKTSAWATNIDSKDFNQAQLITYFENILADPSSVYEIGSALSKQIYAAWALGNLGKPQLVKLDLFRTQATEFDEKVILGLAYASIGDQEKALDVYYEILADYAYYADPYLRIQIPTEKGSADYITRNYIVRSSHVLLLGELTDSTYNNGFANYIQDFRGRAEDLVIDLAEIAYINEQIQKLPKENTKIYFKSAQLEETLELSEGCCKAYSLEANEINNFHLEVLSGKVESYIFYSSDFDTAAQLPQNDQLKIERSYKKVKGEGQKIQPGDIVQVTINFDLDDNSSLTGMYLITDYLPSGLKYIENPHMFGLEPDGWLSHQDQAVNYIFYNSAWWRKNGQKQIVYFARAGSVGTYIAEPALIQAQRKLTIFKMTSTDKIQIHPND